MSLFYLILFYISIFEVYYIKTRVIFKFSQLLCHNAIDFRDYCATIHTEFVFYLEPILLTYLNGHSINLIHPSLNDQSKLNYLISKEKGSKYPYRQDILGVTHEFFKNKTSEDAYIRKIGILFYNNFIIN